MALGTGWGTMKVGVSSAQHRVYCWSMGTCVHVVCTWEPEYTLEGECRVCALHVSKHRSELTATQPCGICVQELRSLKCRGVCSISSPLHLGCTCSCSSGLSTKQVRMSITGAALQLPRVAFVAQ